MNKIYACIDLKSFYASVECIERGLDPLTTNLVVADPERTEKTICLAVSPSLKKYGLSGRARMFEVIKKIKDANYNRKRQNKNYNFAKKSYNDIELENNLNLEIDYIVAKPRMGHYIKYSASVYNVYLKYISEEDIYVYSIDEVFCDITSYLNYNKETPREFITKIIHDIYKTTGITATAGIGTNLYLAKVAMDIVAKKAKPDKYGVRIAGLDEKSYREILWTHKPLTSFWRVGNGYAKKLDENKIYTMGDIALCSLENEKLLYKLFGVNAELLIDHAWGYEPCTIKDIKTYKPGKNSISSGQVLHEPYNYQKTKLIIREMADLLSLDLVSKNLVTDKLILTIEYDIENLKDLDIMNLYEGKITIDHYGRKIPEHAHGTINLEYKTSSAKVITENMIKLFDRIINRNLLVRKINIVADNVINKKDNINKPRFEQFSLFTDYNSFNRKKENEKLEEESEYKLQHVILDIKNKYGKNAILKGMNLEKYATTIERNNQIGGHSK